MGLYGVQNGSGQTKVRGLYQAIDGRRCAPPDNDRLVLSVSLELWSQSVMGAEHQLPDASTGANWDGRYVTVSTVPHEAHGPYLWPLDRQIR